MNFNLFGWPGLYTYIFIIIRSKVYVYIIYTK